METTQSVCPLEILGHPSLLTVNANGLLDILHSYQKSIASKLIFLEQTGCPDKAATLLITSSTKIHMAIRYFSPAFLYVDLKLTLSSQLVVILGKNPADEATVQEIQEHISTVRIFNDDLSKVCAFLVRITL